MTADDETEGAETYGKAERERDYRELCVLIGHPDTPPRFFIDPFLTALAGEYHIHPVNLETFLGRHGVIAEDGESLDELLERKFSKRCVELAHRLV